MIAACLISVGMVSLVLIGPIVAIEVADSVTRKGLEHTDTTMQGCTDES